MPSLDGIISVTPVPSYTLYDKPLWCSIFLEKLTSPNSSESVKLYNLTFTSYKPSNITLDNNAELSSTPFVPKSEPSKTLLASWLLSVVLSK